MMMQWFINEVRARFDKVDALIEKWVKDQIEAAVEIQKLRGEITAMKARMGKKPVE